MKVNKNLEEYIKSQSESAFKKIVNEFTPLIYSACYRKLLDKNTAKDVTQQVFLVFHRKAKSLLAHPNLSGWFYQVAIFTATKHLSKKSREVLRMQTFRDLTELGEETKKIWLEKIMPNLDDAIQELPETLRAAIVEHYLVGNSISEASNKLEISEVAMRQRLSRGVRQLKDYFSSRGTLVSITVLTSILASRNLNAAPAGLNEIISEKAFETISQTHPLIQEIIIMSAGTKLAIGGVIILAIGSLFLLNINKGNPAKNSNPESASLNQVDEKNVQSTSKSISSENRRISIQRNGGQSQEVNDLVGPDLLQFLSLKFKEGINIDEWHQVLAQCGISIPREIYDEHVATYFPDKLLSAVHFDKFLKQVIYHWAKEDHMTVAEWLSQRKMIYTDFTESAYKAVVEKNNDFMKGYNVENIIQFVEALPESEFKNETMKKLYEGTSRVNTPVDLSSPDLAGTLKKLSSAKKEIDQKRIIWNTVMMMVYNGDIKLVEKFIETSEKHKDEITKAALNNYFREDPANAIEWMKKMKIKPDQSDIGHISLNMAKVDFDLGLDYLEKNSEEENLTKNYLYMAMHSKDASPVKRSELILKTIENYSNFKNLDDYSQNGQKLKKQDPNRDHMHFAVIQISGDLAKKHPEEAINWLAELSNKQVIKFNDNVDQLVRNWNWSKYGKEGLKEWADQVNLTDSAKSKFLNYIKKFVKE